MDYIAQGVIQAFVLLWTGDEETWSAIYTTVKMSSISIAVCLALGTPLGFILGYADFPGKKGVRTVVNTLLALPTVAVGLVVYAFISRRGPLGELGILFTVSGMAVGQVILALPIVVALTANAVESMDERLRLTLLTLGADGKRLALSTLYEARYAVLLAAANAYGRIISEVGVSMMLGGNIKWHTRTITTAISLETGKGEFALGIALGLVLLILAFAVNSVLSLARQRATI